jgi:hypothetical protein
MRTHSLKNLWAPTFSLFLSSGTLICCALPALFVSLGMGATLAGLVGTFPQMVWLSEHKNILFPAAGLMLMAAGVLQWRARSLPCPADPLHAKACARLRTISWFIYGFSVLAFITGTFFAYVAPSLLF